MQRLAHTRLACRTVSSSPLRAPRILHATPTVAANPPQCGQWTWQVQQSNYATQALTRRHPPKARRVESQRNVHDPTRALAKELREACEARNVHRLMDLYPTLLEARILSSHDCRHIAQVLHVRIRNASADSKQSDLLLFVHQFTADIRKGALQPHPYAFVHLFGIYKDCKQFIKGVELWQWLVEQDDRYVSPAAYGAAIELMAYGRIMPLRELENLYADALKRFPGTFAEYHLSPTAIVPDRTQPTVVPGIPTILLQGILTARILARDWKEAYLALDTILRLYPSQTPPRFFELFMTERPLSEAYTACMIACRAGVSLRPTHLTALITKMRAAIDTSPSMSDRMLLVRAIANAIYAYMEAGGQLESIHVGGFMHALGHLLPEKTPGQDYEGVLAELRTLVAVAAHEILRRLIQSGLALQIHPFEALISLSGRLRLPSLLSTTLNDVTTAGIDLGPVGTRSAITSAGLLGNKELVEQLWDKAVSAAEAQSAQIPFEDWITLTKACRRAGHFEYFRKQLLKLPHAITSKIQTHLVKQIKQHEPVTSDHETFSYLIPGDLASQLDALKAQIKNIETVVMSGQPLDLSQTPFYMHIDPNAPSLGSTEDLRGVYDSMTTDPYQPPPAQLTEGAPVKLAKSPTGVLLDELRFQNWVTILEMMDDAELYESALQFAIDAAIKAGEPLKGRPELLRIRKESGPERRNARAVRLKVQALRAPSLQDVPIFHKVDSAVPEDKYKPMAYDPIEKKWSTRKIAKHPTAKQPNFARSQSLELDRPEGAPLKLTYYVGLESEHGAPWKTPRQTTLRRVVIDDKSPSEAASAQNAPTDPFRSA